jgi:hypothetical protein
MADKLAFSSLRQSQLMLSVILYRKMSVVLGIGSNIENLLLVLPKRMMSCVFYR